MIYEVSFDIAAILIFIILIILFYGKKKSPYRYNIAFGTLLAVSLLTALFDLIGAYMISYPDLFPQWLSYIVNMIYLIAQNTATPIYAYYVILLTGSGRRIGWRIGLLLLVPYWIELLLILTTPLTEWIIGYDQNGFYQHGTLFPLLYILVVYYFILGACFLIKYNKSLSFDKQFALFSFLPVNGAGMLIQMRLPQYLLNPFCMTISMTLLLFSVQNAEEILDNASGAFDERTFGVTLENHLLMEQKFWLMAVNITNYELVEKSIGADRIEDILKKAVKYLSQINRKAIVGRMGDQLFGVRLPDMPYYEMEKLAEETQERFAKPFDDIQRDACFQTRLICIACPHEATTLEQIADIISHIEEKSDENSVFFAANIDQVERNRNFEIRRAIRTAIDEHGFEMYYQPIYSVEEQRVVSAEALIRLNDQKLGFISPEIFIPIAEKGGYILEIGNFVFESVCQFFQENRLAEYGIHYVEVNLSVVECMQHDLAKRLFDITRRYGLSPEYLNLEITETATAGSIERLRHTMQRLTEDGFVFSMDDYGTGYSNIKSVYDLPFEYIKIDKSILWTSMENEKAYTVLKNTFLLAKELGKKIIMEGVETEEHIRRLTELGCDYFQGYYFSKPIPGDQFIQYLKEH
ncbi:MAG: EAL domain-containing protein [bacterium]|nr:EAL domain-containing protein [bacterium]